MYFFKGDAAASCLADFMDSHPNFQSEEDKLKCFQKLGRAQRCHRKFQNTGFVLGSRILGSTEVYRALKF